MIYPTISEYIEAIKAAEDNFKELINLRPVLGEDGLPVMTGGNFAVVFQMKEVETGKLYALKCFTKDQVGRGEAYRLITEELKGVDSPYLTSIRYLDKELFVDTNQSPETEFPVLLMDWVEGKTLDKYLRENLDDKYALEMLAYRFCLLAQWLIPQPFAHGDLKPDNILVRGDGTLVLVDYDGMYVPAMKGQKARELGSPDFRHPLRTEKDFDEHIDGFPLVSILLSLKAISLSPELLNEYGAPDRLLFSVEDYRLCYPNRCKLINRLRSSFYDKELIDCCLLFNDYLDLNLKETLLNISIEEPQIRKNLLTSIAFQEWENRIEGDWPGAYYSNDYKKLMRFIDTVGYSYLGDSYEDTTLKCEIYDKTNVLCDKCFADNHTLKYFKIPRSVHYIGEKAFAGCRIRYIELSDSIWYISEDAFDNCINLHTIIIPPQTFTKFSRLLPNNIHQLYEMDAHFVKSKITSFLNQNKKQGTTYWESLLLLSDAVNYWFGIFEKLTCYKNKHEDNSGYIEMCTENSIEETFFCYNVKNVESIDDIVNAIYYLLLDFDGVDILNRIGYLWKNIWIKQIKNDSKKLNSCNNDPNNELPF